GKKLYRKLKVLCSTNNMDRQAYLKLLKRIKKNNKNIEKSIVYEFIEDTVMLADQIIKTGQYQAYSTFEEEGLEIARKGEKYMELVGQCAELFEKLAKDTVAAIAE
ncbi:MAG: hypothetical protein MR324_09630, partial [Lachnospiraceae bacterium]|nr:hypothetical protein [Lachnospiraceae bacterium]